MRTIGSQSSVFISVVVLASGVFVGTQVAADSGKDFVNPEAGLSYTQREALHQAAHDRNAAFLAAFVAGHGDPHTLPVVEVETYAAPPSFSAALAAATVVVEGRISTVDYSSNPSGGMPFASATVALVKTLRGHPSSSTVVILQSGGPVAQGDGGGLVQFDVDPLLLPNDNYYLLLTAAPSPGEYTTVPGSGVIKIQSNGTVVVADHSPAFSVVNGKSADEVATLLSTN